MSTRNILANFGKRNQNSVTIKQTKVESKKYQIMATITLILSLGITGIAKAENNIPLREIGTIDGPNKGEKSKIYEVCLEGRKWYLLNGKLVQVKTTIRNHIKTYGPHFDKENDIITEAPAACSK